MIRGILAVVVALVLGLLLGWHLRSSSPEGPGVSVSSEHIADLGLRSEREPIPDRVPRDPDAISYKDAGQGISESDLKWRAFFRTERGVELVDAALMLRPIDPERAGGRDRSLYPLFQTQSLQEQIECASHSNWVGQYSEALRLRQSNHFKELAKRVYGGEEVTESELEQWVSGQLQIIWALRGLNRFEQSILFGKEVFKHDPDNFMARRNKGICLEALGKFDQARGLYIELLDELPSQKELNLKGSEAYERLALDPGPKMIPNPRPRGGKDRLIQDDSDYKRAIAREFLRASLKVRFKFVAQKI